jgi:predicted N-acetyltransferase YhbS
VAGDRDAIRAVHLASFPSDAEARLVDALRAGGRLVVSLVALEHRDDVAPGASDGPPSMSASVRSRQSMGPAVSMSSVPSVISAPSVSAAPSASSPLRRSSTARWIVGHVAFSPISVDGFAGGVGLAPVAVLPAFRERGVAAGLVREGLRACADLAYRFVVVLGEPRYYGRFGFLPASRWGLHDEYGGGDAFQALELHLGILGEHRSEAQRLVRYAQEFAALPSD